MTLLAVRMEGIVKDAHNRVEKVRWATRYPPCFPPSLQPRAASPADS